MENQSSQFKSGFVAIVGRPNVGKSTLLNRLVGQKIAITAKKPQTTRHRITGVTTTDHVQRIYVDTPGIHGKQKKALNKQLNKTATSALQDVDTIVFVVSGTHWQDDDDLVLSKLNEVKAPVILVINKCDLVNPKSKLLETVESLKNKHDFAAIIPVSAKKDASFDALESEIDAFLPEGPLLYGEEQVTDRTDRFRMAECVREKLFRALGDELPYGLSVEIISTEYKNKKFHLHCTIWVEAERHKPIVIGDKGAQLKQVGISARKDLEAMFDRPFVVKLWVKVKQGWSDDLKALRSLGYVED